MYIRVRVIPGSKKETVTRKGEAEFEMTVREPAQQNFANKRIIQILAGEFKTSPRQVRLVSGHRSGSKLFNIELLK